MYVRWKRRACRKQIYRWRQIDGRRAWARASEPTGNYALSAQLVESRRVDGKPRQKVIKYLGVVNESRIGYVGHRIGFWRTVRAAFLALGLPPEQQRTIELALHERVPFPAEEEVAAEAERFRQLEESLHQSLGR